VPPDFVLPVIIKSMTNTCGCVMFSGWTVGVVKGVKRRRVLLVSLETSLVYYLKSEG